MFVQKNTMKRFLLLMIPLLALASSCKPASPQLNFKSCEITDLGSLDLGPSGVNAGVTLSVGIENKSKSDVTVESLLVTLYKKVGGSKFADLTLKEPLTVPAGIDDKLSVPLNLVLANPLALLMGGGIKSIKPEDYLADIDLNARMGAFKRNIHEEGIPLESLLELLNQKKIEAK